MPKLGCHDKGMGICLPELPHHEHINNEKRQKFAQKTIEYPQLQMIICYRGIYKCEHNEKLGKSAPLQVVYVNGVDNTAPVVTVRIDNLKKGDYYVLYRADFKKEHLFKTLNLVFYSEFQQKLTNEEASRI